MRKKLFNVLIGVFIIQLLVPTYMIVYSVTSERKIETYGKEYYLEVAPTLVTKNGEIYFDIYSEQKILNESYKLTTKNKDYLYVQIDTSSDGLAYLHDLSYDKPLSDNYIRSNEKRLWAFPENYYSVDEDTAKAMSNYIDKNRRIGWLLIASEKDDIKRRYEDTITVRIIVYKGKMLLKGMYINNIPIEKYFSKQ